MNTVGITNKATRGFNRTVCQEQVDPAGHTRRLTYNEAGRLISIQNENNAFHHFEYDLLGQLIKETGFDGRIQTYHYNITGQLLAKTEASLPGDPTTRYEYNEAGQLTARHLPATERVPAITEHYRWGKDGNLIAAETPDSKIDFTYDALGRLTKETQHQRQNDGQEWQWTAQHEYAPNGTRSSSTYGDLPPVQWLTHGSEHLYGVKLPGVDIDFERDELHREIKRNIRTQAHPLVMAFGSRYDEPGNLIEQRAKIGDEFISNKRYGYDTLNRLNQITDKLFPHKNIAYHYDQANRLIGSQHGQKQFQYALDPAGNRITPKQPDAIQKNWPENRITELDGIKNHYDGAGNLTERSHPDGTCFKLYYDGAHRLTHLIRTNPDNTTVFATYTYDAFSRRIMKEVRQGNEPAPVITRYGWDGDRLVHETTPSTRTTLVYELTSFVPMARIEEPPLAALKPLQGTPETAVFVTDHAGTPHKLVDKAGKTLWEAEPDDWHGVRNGKGARQLVRFQGQWLDEESGFYYNRYRYYDPAQGRYLSQDPMGLQGGLNTSAYQVNPVGYVDPLGLWGEDAHREIIKSTFTAEPWLSLLPEFFQNGNQSDSRLVTAIIRGAATLNSARDPAYHAMRKLGEGGDDARDRALAFIHGNLAIFKKSRSFYLKRQKDDEKRDADLKAHGNGVVRQVVSDNFRYLIAAYSALGKALHPVIDSTSPSHKGWQPWPKPIDLSVFETNKADNSNKENAPEYGKYGGTKLNEGVYYAQMMLTVPYDYDVPTKAQYNYTKTLIFQAVKAYIHSDSIRHTWGK
jgi:RHS repeat-associated protein